jgi:hypothetical protein
MISDHFISQSLLVVALVVVVTIEKKENTIEVHKY